MAKPKADVDNGARLQLLPQPDATGDLSTLGTAWGWQVVSYPTMAIIAFSPTSTYSDREAALAAAREQYPDVQEDDQNE